MNLRHNLSVFFSTSWPKTIYFNLHYFGLKGISLPIIVGRKFKLKKMKGSVHLPSAPMKKIFLGRDDFDWMTAPGC